MTRSTADAGLTGPAAAAQAAAAGPRAARPTRWSRRRRLRKTTELSILLGPGLVLFIVFVLGPIAVGIYYSLYNWDGYGPLTRLHRPEELHDRVQVR